MRNTKHNSNTTQLDTDVKDLKTVKPHNHVIYFIGEAPCHQNGTSMKVPKLEKLLVDLFCDDALLVAYKGGSQQTIFENALTRYDINFKTLFAYAERRKKEAALKTYLHQYFQTELKQLLE